jgi:hypothetical protein
MASSDLDSMRLLVWKGWVLLAVSESVLPKQNRSKRKRPTHSKARGLIEWITAIKSPRTARTHALKAASQPVCHSLGLVRFLPSLRHRQPVALPLSLAAYVRYIYMGLDDSRSSLCSPSIQLEGDDYHPPSRFSSSSLARGVAVRWTSLVVPAG